MNNYLYDLMKNEQEFIDYLNKKGIYQDKILFVKLCLQGFKLKDIAKTLNYSKFTINNWSVECKKKLKIDKWKF